MNESGLSINDKLLKQGLINETVAIMARYNLSLADYLSFIQDWDLIPTEKLAIGYGYQVPTAVNHPISIQNNLAEAISQAKTQEGV